MKGINAQTEVLGIIGKHGQLTIAETAHYANNEDIDTIKDHMLKLRKAGYLDNIGKHQCDKCYSFRNVYKITPKGVKYLDSIKLIHEKVKPR